MLFKFLFINLLKYITIILVLILILFPVYYLIIISFMSNDFVLTDNPSFVSDGFNIENYLGIFDYKFWNAVLLTFNNIVIVLIIKLFILFFGAYGLFLLNEKLKIIFFSFFLFISIIPEASIYFNLLRLRNEIFIMNQSVVFTLSVTSFFSFFSLTYFYNTFQQISQKEKNIIYIDKLNWYEKFIYGYFPKLKLPFLLTIIFTTIEVWNSFLWPSIILSGRTDQNINIWYSDLGHLEGGGQLLNIVSAGAVVSLVIPLGIYLIFSKFINRSMYKFI